MDAATPPREPAGTSRAASSQGDHADRHVDVEHPAPAVRAGERGHDQPADHRTGRGGQPDGGAEDAERPATLGAAEQVLDQPGVLRDEHAAGDALQQPGGDQQADGRRRPGQCAGHHERGQGDQEHPAPAEASPSRPAGTSASPKVKRVAGHHPLHGSRRRAEPALDRRQRHVDDADVQQGHERRDQGDRQRVPPSRPLRPLVHRGRPGRMGFVARCAGHGARFAHPAARVCPASAHPSPRTAGLRA